MLVEASEKWFECNKEFDYNKMFNNRLKLLKSGQYAFLSFYKFPTYISEFNYNVFLMITDDVTLLMKYIIFSKDEDTDLIDDLDIDCYSPDAIQGGSGLEGLRFALESIKEFMDGCPSGTAIEVEGFEKRGRAYRYLERIGFQIYHESFGYVADKKTDGVVRGKSYVYRFVKKEPERHESQSLDFKQNTILTSNIFVNPSDNSIVYESS